MSPALAFIGISILGTWGLASLGLIVGGIFMLFFPGNPVTPSDHVLGGIVLIIAGLISGGLMQIVVAPLLGLDPPIPLRAKNIIPAARLTHWAKAGLVRDYPDGLPKEVRLRSQRVTMIRQGDRIYALNGLCSHARLPLAGFPASPIKPYPIKDDCVMCPFHGARFEVATGRVIRQPFSDEFNNNHPFLGRLQSKLFFFNKEAEDMQTFPVRIENGEIEVGMPK